MTGLLIQGAQMQVAQLPLAPAMSPLGCKDHEIERVGRLYFEPAAAPDSGFVRRVGRFNHDSLMAGSASLGEEPLRQGHFGNQFSWNTIWLRDRGCQFREPFGFRPMQQGFAVPMQAVKKIWSQWESPAHHRHVQFTSESAHGR